MKTSLLLSFVLLNLGFSNYSVGFADETNSLKSKKKASVQIEKLTIRGNKELPKVLFIVPWQKQDKLKSQSTNQELVLHSLYGDLFEPVNPETIQK